ncbi:acetate--CoA ligase [Sinimarinibacterium sp. NLF-5-8]|uniref:acetate--CoA ligase n=1 Tax=Sinimarinibacterium sp. NLF-5-8 TaxID=2698684 RepID=UPI00137B94A3|nr:acetate--CoA ligase [Sinimarinibacterium sp. NLF-5-8]QHS11141.1 acetate--CoA ligase [Sinimarinibacterium sp. NLF-5-8]
MSSNTNIQSVLTENRAFAPSAEFVGQAQLNADKLAALHAAAQADHLGFWADLARKEVAWQTPFTTVLDDAEAPNFKWFVDGRTNASVNCLDRHLGARGDQVAIRYEGEQGDTRTYTYKQLHAEVCKTANALKSLGVAKGDRVAIYMPMTADAAIAMLACARIGAIHTVIFGGFSASSIKDRVEDTQAKLLITSDGGRRGGHIVELKRTADDALAQGCATIEKVLMFRRTGHDVPFNPARDVWANALIEQQSTECEPEWVESEHPLFLLYTSGSTGKPKGIQHSTGGYMVGATATSKWVFDLRQGDVFWCTADVGWVTGHSYVVYGPLSAGSTVMMYEGTPMVPDAGRFWKICQDHGVTIFYTAPTAIRALMKAGDQWPGQYDLSKLRLLGSVGEPINPEAWMWYHRVVGKEKLPIVDTWWQTETGTIMISPIPGAIATKPGSCTKPLPGIAVDIVDEGGNRIEGNDQGGYLVVTKPWPSMLRGIWGNPERFVSTYWGQFKDAPAGYATPTGKWTYLAGDGAHRDTDGYYWIMGRTDDVLNVSGHRLGTMEIESALVSHPRVAEAAVVGRPHEVKGESVFAFVICNGERPTGADAEAFTKELREHVAREIGALAKPDDIRFADNLPKTRSGKIMRRLLRSIAKGEVITQDTSTLENPGIVDQLAGKA